MATVGKLDQLQGDALGTVLWMLTAAPGGISIFAPIVGIYPAFTQKDHSLKNREV